MLQRYLFVAFLCFASLFCGVSPVFAVCSIGAKSDHGMKSSESATGQKVYSFYNKQDQLVGKAVEFSPDSYRYYDAKGQNVGTYQHEKLIKADGTEIKNTTGCFRKKFYRLIGDEYPSHHHHQCNMNMSKASS
ncbi:hypothetical protein FAI40_05040 [Acetobacteraceae bacterium]|nr:hypothetical protein FAI40_05040 [Acetobacteraceae bacterium]